MWASRSARRPFRPSGRGCSRRISSRDLLSASVSVPHAVRNRPAVVSHWDVVECRGGRDGFIRTGSRDRTLPFPRSPQGLRGVGPLAELDQGVGTTVDHGRPRSIAARTAAHHDHFRRPRGAAGEVPARNRGPGPGRRHRGRRFGRAGRALRRLATAGTADAAPALRRPRLCRSVTERPPVACSFRACRTSAWNTVPPGWRPRPTERSPAWSAGSGSTRSATRTQQSWRCCWPRSRLAKLS